jgi:uncharacterized protein (DUF4213/DUF364 family)
LSRLHREEDLGFHGLAYERIKNIDDTVIAPHIQQYKTAIDDFDKALKQELASLITGEIKELDFQIGLTYHGLRDVVNRMLRYTNESKAAAARKIDFVVRKYDAKTNPALLALVEQTEVFQNMIADLKDPAVFPFLSTVGAKSWFEDLDAYNTRLSQLYSRRTTETSVFVAGLSKECRTNVDKKYREIVEYINTMIRIKQTGQYEPVVPELNRLVDEMKIVLAERKTTNENRRNRNLKLAGVDDIPVQIYTGSPVYPPFQLFLNGNLLAPGVDYTAAYKNNVNPGTATVTVAGKGATIGKKEITFNIERTL